jgi:hypothetical protein
LRGIDQGDIAPEIPGTCLTLRVATGKFAHQKSTFLRPKAFDHQLEMPQ